MNKAKILIVEDDAAISNLIATTLETQDYQYHVAKTGVAALLEAASYSPDVVILDLGLPDMDGVDIIRKVRGWSNLPIIVVSARNEDSDKVSALDAGADDYLTKPFSVEELLARLREMCIRDRVNYNVRDVSIEETAQLLHTAPSMLSLQEMYRLASVSYTHLDVYKRQGYALQLVFSTDKIAAVPVNKVLVHIIQGLTIRCLNGT